MAIIEKQNVFCILKFIAIIVSGLILSIGAARGDSPVQKIMDNKSAPDMTEPAYLVGFAQDTMDNDWRRQQVLDVEHALVGDSSIRFIMTDAKGQTAKQIMDIEGLIDKGVDVLITSPRDAQALAPVISQAYQQGIPVVLLSRRIDSEDFTIFIAPDNREIGRKAARYIGEKYPLGGRILMLKGVPNATTTINRTQGFIEELEKFKQLEIVVEKTANYLRGDAITSVEEVLNSGIQFDIIYAQSDSMASGARMAIKHADIDLNKISIIGIDYIREAQAAIRAGEQDISFSYPTCGKEGADYVLRILKGQEVPKKVVVNSEMVSIKNIEQVRPIF